MESSTITLFEKRRNYLALAGHEEIFTKAHVERKQIDIHMHHVLANGIIDSYQDAMEVSARIQNEKQHTKGVRVTVSFFAANL